MSESTAIVHVDENKVVPDHYVGVIAPNYYCRGWNGKRSKYCSSRAGKSTDHPGFGRCGWHGGRSQSGEHVKHGHLRRFAFSGPRIRELMEKHEADPRPTDILPELALARSLLEDYIERYEQNRAAIEAWYQSWEGKHIPIPESEKAALLDALDEHETLLKETGEPTADEFSKLELARSAVLFLATPQERRPRYLLDVADAMRFVDTISKVIHRYETVRTAGAISLDQLKRFLFAVERVIEIRIKDPDLRQRITDDILAISV